MFLIRSIAQARTGRRDEAVALMKEMSAAAAKAVQMPVQRVLTASIGPCDSTVVTESEVESLAAFEKSLEAMNRWAGMQTYGPKLAEVFIDGTHRFEIYRVC